MVVESREAVDQFIQAVILKAWRQGSSNRKVHAWMTAIGSDAGTVPLGAAP